MITFKALPPSLLKKSFFLAIVRYMSAIFGNLTHGIYLELSMLYRNFFILKLTRLISNLALNFSFSKYSSILGHLMLL